MTALSFDPTPTSNAYHSDESEGTGHESEEHHGGHHSMWADLNKGLANWINNGTDGHRDSASTNVLRSMVGAPLAAVSAIGENLGHEVDLARFAVTGGLSGGTPLPESMQTRRASNGEIMSVEQIENEGRDGGGRTLLEALGNDMGIPSTPRSIASNDDFVPETPVPTPLAHMYSIPDQPRVADAGSIGSTARGLLGTGLGALIPGPMGNVLGTGAAALASMWT